MTFTTTINLISSTLGLMSLTWGIYVGFKGWIATVPLRNSGDRMDAYLALADRLELMGEPEWAREQRANGWLTVLRELEAFEDARRTTWPYVVAAVSGTAFVLGLGSMAFNLNPWMSRTGAVTTLVGLLGWIVFMTHESRRASRIAASARRRLAWHQERGDIDHFEDVRALTQPRPPGTTMDGRPGGEEDASRMMGRRSTRSRSGRRRECLPHDQQGAI